MILLVDKIEKSFGARVLFSGASFQINPGERFALVGPNGAGKTTMLKIIMGIDSPDAAQADTPVAAPKPAEGKKTKEQKRAEAQARAALNKKLKGVRNQLKKIETELDKKRARYDELMELMASEELYADQDKFNAALGEYNGLKQELPKLEDEWLELSTQIEEETARELS